MFKNRLKYLIFCAYILYYVNSLKYKLVYKNKVMIFQHLKTSVYFYLM